MAAPLETPARIATRCVDAGSALCRPHPVRAGTFDMHALDCPAPLYIRNTFLDAQFECGFPSNDTIVSSIVSLPAHGMSEIESDCYIPGELLKRTAAVREFAGGVDESASECSTVDTMEAAEPHKQGYFVTPTVALKIAGAIDMPGLQASLPLLSRGSAGHAARQCKPCAFFHTKGCSSGMDCQYCHMCGPEERQLRKKEKRAYFGQVRHMKKVVASGLRLPGTNEQY